MLKIKLEIIFNVSRDISKVDMIFFMKKIARNEREKVKFKGRIRFGWNNFSY